MENSTFYLVSFVLYTILMIILGWYVSRNQKNGDDFLLAGRGLPMFLTLGTTVATMVGTGSSMGAVGFGYANGWAGMLYGVGGSVGIILLALWFSPVRELRFMTMSEELSYYTGASRLVKNIVGIMIFVASVGWLGAHILGGSMYLAWASGISLSSAKILVAAGFAVYVVIGGYTAVVWTDTVQAVILFFGFILMAVLSVAHVGGWEPISKAVDPAALSLFAMDKIGVLPALSLATVIGIGVLATPSYRQRIYSGKNVQAVRFSFLLTGGLYLFFSILPAIIGMAAYTANPTLENSNYAFPFATTFLPATLAMIVLIAGLSATMSSASSDAITAVSVMVRDLYTIVTGKMPAQDRTIFLSRLFVVVVVGLATLFALFSNDIIGYISKMISTLMSGLCACSLLGRFWQRFNWQGAIAALITGSVTAVAFMFNASWNTYWGNPCIPSVGMALLLGIVVSLATPPNALSRAEALEILTRERENLG